MEKFFLRRVRIWLFSQLDYVGRGSMPTYGKFNFHTLLNLYRQQFNIIYKWEKGMPQRLWFLCTRKNSFPFKEKYITFLHTSIRYWLIWLLYRWGSFHWGWNGQRQRWWGIRDVWLGRLRINGVFSKRMSVELNIHYLHNQATIGLMNPSSVSQKAPNLSKSIVL